jgi:hypothetical protein
VKFQNIKLNTYYVGYECWTYELDNQSYAYTTMEKEWMVDSFTAICYAKDLYGSKRLAVVYQYLPLGTEPAKNLEKFYKLLMLQ